MAAPVQQETTINLATQIMLEITYVDILNTFHYAPIRQKFPVGCLRQGCSSAFGKCGPLHLFENLSRTT